MEKLLRKNNSDQVYPLIETKRTTKRTMQRSLTHVQRWIPNLKSPNATTSNSHS